MSVKTAVVGNIESTINKLRASKHTGEQGGIILGVGFYKSLDNVEVKLVLCLIPDQTLHSCDTHMIKDAILKQLDEKSSREGYIKYEVVALNDAIALARAKSAILAARAASDAKATVFNLVGRVDGLAGGMDTLTKRVDGLTQQINEQFNEFKKEIRDDINDLKSGISEIKKLLKFIQEKKG
ncbi:MAG: hypothetical protein ACTSWN_07605 [Promethearchaeota archaeon]